MGFLTDNITLPYPSPHACPPRGIRRGETRDLLSFYNCYPYTFGMITHHSEDFINEMKQRLTAERDQLRARLGAHSHLDHGDFVATAPEYARHEEENAMEAAEQVALEGITEAEEARLKEIEAALGRIEAGTYGVTREGELIPEARLRANPAATTVVK